jgi:hypothetical protein
MADFVPIDINLSLIKYCEVCDKRDIMFESPSKPELKRRETSEMIR